MTVTAQLLGPEHVEITWQPDDLAADVQPTRINLTDAEVAEIAAAVVTARQLAAARKN